jgi:hypothetical protein
MVAQLCSAMPFSIVGIIVAFLGGILSPFIIGRIIRRKSKKDKVKENS